MKESCWEIPPLAPSFSSPHVGPIVRTLKEKRTMRVRGFLPSAWKKGLGFLFLEFFDSFSDAGRFLI